MNLPDLAIINFSNEDDQRVRKVIRAVNRQVAEDFLPIWGSGYACKLHAAASAGTLSVPGADPDGMDAERVPAEAVIYLVDGPHVARALGHHAVSTAELPAGFVFTDLEDWTVTLSHEVLELIVDPTVNVFVPGPDPRTSNNPHAWLWHTYEVCDAVERTIYEIDGVDVSNFVTPSYFAEGNAAGTGNDFLGVGVDSFGVLPGCHLGAVDPVSYNWVTVVSEAVPCSARLDNRRLMTFARQGPRSRAEGPEDERLLDWKARHPEHARQLKQLTSFTRGGRKSHIMMRRRCARH